MSRGAAEGAEQATGWSPEDRDRRLTVAIKIISTAKAPVEFSQKFLPREISSLNATYKHLNVVLAGAAL